MANNFQKDKTEKQAHKKVYVKEAFNRSYSS